MRSLLWILIILSVALSAQAATLNVYPDGSGTYATIQDAIDVSVNGGVIQLADGVFTGPGNRDLDTNEMRVSIVSMSGDPLLSVIDCQGSPSEPHFGISYSALGADTILRGITVRNGYSATDGGALIMSDAAITVENCIFEDNYAYNNGGAVYAVEWSAPTFINCIFQNNTAYYYGQGGAIYAFEGGSVNIDRCLFAGNQASYGGALYFESECTPTVQSSTFWNNSGNNIYVSIDCVLTMDRSILAFNTGRAVLGVSNSQVQLSCCNVFGNPSGNWVGVLTGQGVINNNLEANPLMCNPAGGDFTLHSASPCAAFNNPSCGLIGVYPVNCWNIITVNADFSGDYPTIQDAIDAAISGVDIIELLDGDYSLSDYNINFLGKAITVRSASGDPTNCIIGTILSNARGFIFETAEGPDSILQGVTIRGFESNSLGGGVFIDGASPHFENCIIEENFSTNGSGVCVIGGSPTFNNCDFIRNQVRDYSLGGALYSNTDGDVLFTSCRFMENGTESGDATGVGSVAYIVGTGSIKFEKCVFADNYNTDRSIISYSIFHGLSDFDRCTFYGNTVSNYSLFRIDSDEPVTITNSILVNNNVVDWASYYYGSSEMIFGCTNIFGNLNGDWTGSIADQASHPTNMSMDPKFCNAPAWDFSLEATSPCLPFTPPNQYCDQLGAELQGCDYRGLVTSVADVPNDQGRRVRITWNPSSQDNVGTPYGITNYSIWRKINDPQRKAICPPAGKSNHADKFPEGDWDYVSSVPARGDYQYNVLCETLADSTVSGGMHLSTFFVSAETNEPTLYFDSQTASGYSVDNLAPGVPENMRLETPTLLAWDEISAADFDYFTVYGSSSGNLDGSESELGKTTTLEMTIPETSYPYYLLTATDYSGNDGQAAILVTGISGVEDGVAMPTRFALYLPWPNPGTRGTNFSFDLPQASMVNISIYDLAGRKVSTVVNSVLAAGNHVVAWTGGESRSSGNLASGVYFYRMQAGDFSKSGRIMILK